MQRFDIQLSPECAQAEFRPGDAIRGRVLLTPDRDFLTTTGLWLRLQWRTSGEGNVERGVAQDVCLAPGPLGAGDAVDAPFEFPCPAGPFSASHALVSVGWVLEARVELPEGLPPVTRLPVQVVPGPCASPDLGVEAGHAQLDDSGFTLDAAGRRPIRAFTWLGVGVLTVAAVFGYLGLEEPALYVAVMGGFALLGALMLNVRHENRQGLFGKLSVEVPGGRTLDTGATVNVRIAFTPAEAGALREVATAWQVEEYAWFRERRDHPTEFRAETPSAFTQHLHEPLPLRAGEPVSLDVPVQVPEEPSFRGEHNRVSWALLVRLRTDRSGTVLYRVPAWLRPPAAP